MIRRYVVIAALAVAAAGCGDDTPTAPSGPPTTVVFNAALRPTNEVPPVTNADAGATGAGTFTLNLTRDGAGTITAATGTFAYTLSGFPAGTTIQGTHIHTGGPGVNGGVLINSGLSAANTLTLATGAVTNQTYPATAAISATQAQEIITNPNGFYFNVHTAINPGGAIRAQLVIQ